MLPASSHTRSQVAVLVDRNLAAALEPDEAYRVRLRQSAVRGYPSPSILGFDFGLGTSRQAIGGSR